MLGGVFNIRGGDYSGDLPSTAPPRPRLQLPSPGQPPSLGRPRPSSLDKDLASSLNVHDAQQSW